MTLSGKKVVVTGAGGFIGSHLAERLVEAGASVRALVHYNALGSWGWLDHSRFARDMEVISGDITDRDCAQSIIRGREIVFHLGALIAIPYSYQAPLSYLRTNIEGTLNLLQACREQGILRFIHTSTSEVYGTARYVPIDERHPLHGQSPYSASKIAADKLAEAYHCSFGVPIVTVRPFNTFGPRQSGRAIIPTIITQAIEGDSVRLGNLRPTRDLNYVANTVDGFVRAAISEQAIGETINLGSGREISVGDLANLIGKLLNKPIRIFSEEQRLRPDNSEVERLLADNQLAQKLLGWTPKVTLEQGLEHTIAWMRENTRRYRIGVYTV